MPKASLTTFRLPAIAAGGITAISLFVLLVCSLAADQPTASGILPPGGETWIPNTCTTDMPFLGWDEFDVAFMLSGDKQNRSSCSDGVTEGPEYKFERPTSASGGLYAIGLRCASDLCTEYHFSALVVLQSLSAQNSISWTSQGFYHIVIPVFAVRHVQTGIARSSLSTDRALPTCTSQNCQLENVSEEGQDLPTSGTVLGNPTPWRAKIGERAMQSQAEEKWDGKDRKRKLRRLGRVLVGLLVITVFMWVF